MSDQEAKNRQIDRLENEHRKDHLAVQGIETRVSGLEEQLAGINKNIKSFQSELKRLTTLLSGNESFDTEMANFRLDVGKMIEKKDKQVGKQLDERLALITKDLDGLNTSLAQMRQSTNTIAQMKKDVKALRDDDDRLTAMHSEDRKLIDEIHKQYIANQETMSILESTRKRESKTISELTSDVTALRKHSDDHRAKLDLNQEALKKTTTNLDEFIARDEQRTDSYRALIDEMKLTQYEHDKTWREWLNRFDVVNKTAVELENKLNALDDAQRKAKLSQKGLDDATIRIERRINEIAEMQRLAEERAHQDWDGYVLDEQKRWKTYTVSNEEALSESKRQIEAIKTRLATLEDTSRLMNDTVLMLSEETQKKLQGFLELYHEWAATNADILSRSRPR
jgi:chromosome segregation ATPase